jgi:hypothetical protein
MLLAMGVLIGDKMPATSDNAARGGALFGFPKRKLSPLQRACLSLGLKIDARPRTNVTRLLRRAGLGNTAIEYLEFSKGEQARQIVQLYRYLKSATERKAVTIDYLIMAADADPHHVWGLIQEGVSRLRKDQAVLLVCASMPDVTRAAIKRALTPEGHKDRELVFQIYAGFVAASTPNPSVTSGNQRRGI